LALLGPNTARATGCSEVTDIAKNAEPMEPDTVRREVSSDEAGAYTAQTTADALPYGTYDVRETATNGSC